MRDSEPASWARAVEVDEALRLPGAVANRSQGQSMYSHRSCLPMAVVDLGGRDLGDGVSHPERAGMCGLSPDERSELTGFAIT